MPQDVSDAFIKQYERDVHQAYQRRGSFIRPTVRVKTGVKGASTTFQTTGRGIAGTKGRHGLVPVMNVSHDPVECTVQDFYAGDWVDKLDELKINIDERMVLVNAGAWALGRKTDELIFAQMAQNTNTAVTMASTSAAAVRNAAIAAVTALFSRDIPDDGQTYACLSWQTWSKLLTVEEFASADYVDVSGRPFAGKAFQSNGQWKRWMGVMWTAQNGLPIDGNNVRSNFIWHKTAIGHGVGQDVTSDITWHGDRAAHFVNNMMSQGSCLIDNEGVQTLNYDEDGTLPTADTE